LFRLRTIWYSGGAGIDAFRPSNQTIDPLLSPIRRRL
jgi:hypothetical protein